MKMAEVKSKYPQYADIPDTELAVKLHAKFYSDMPFSQFAEKVGLNPEIPVPGAPVDPGVEQPERSVGEMVTGAGEAALGAVSGATTGLLGQVGGTAYGATREALAGKFGTPQAASRIAQTASDTARALSYEPRTAAGREYVGDIGEAASVLPPIIPLAPQIQGLGGAAAMQAGQAAMRTPAQVRALVERARGGGDVADPDFDFGDLSAGAAQVPEQQRRVELSQSLPIPIDLSKREITGAFEDARFELETAKNVDLGSPLRESSNLKNRQLIQNLEHFIDSTGAEIRDVQSGAPTTEFGRLFSGALETEAKIARKKYNDLYSAANASPEGDRLVSLSPLVEYINKQGAMGKDENATVLRTISRTLSENGSAYFDESGRLVASNKMPLRNLEEVRKKINTLIGTNNTNAHFGTQMKRVIDGIAEESGGDLYRAARAMKTQFHNKFTDKLLVKKLTTLKKNTLDRQVAYEDVARTVMGGSRDDVAHIKKILQNAGKEGSPERATGVQAWRELQGQVVQNVLKEATKNIERTEWNDPVVSAHALNTAITNLERGGKLDLFFGKKGAEQIRDLNEVAKFIKVAPRGSFNTSNTATILLAAIEALASPLTSAVGLPPFVLTGLKVINDQRKKKQAIEKIKEHVSYGKKISQERDQ